MKSVSWSPSVPPQAAASSKPQPAVSATAGDLLFAKSQMVRVSEDSLADLSPFLPTTEVGHSVWLSIESTWRGEVCKATLHDAEGGLEDIDDGEETRVALDPRAAVRLVHSVEGLESDELRHLSIAATHAMWPPKSKDADAPPMPHAPPPPREAAPARRVRDHFLLTRLEDFVQSHEFSARTEAFAAEHAHKFKPLTEDDEHPLYYQELYLRFETVIEAALEAFLAEYGSSTAELLHAVTDAKERGEPLCCVDVLLASSKYENFLELMLDYKFSLYAEREITPTSVLSEVSSPDSRARA